MIFFTVAESKVIIDAIERAKREYALSGGRSRDFHLEEQWDSIVKKLEDSSQNDFLACFGLGPKYTRKKNHKEICHACNGHNAYYKEEHPDTDMNTVVLYCPDCGATSD